MINVHTDSSDRGFVLGNKVLVAEVFAKNGFLVLSSDTGEEKTSGVNADQIDQGMKTTVRITRDATLHVGEEVIRSSSEGSPAKDVSTEGE